MTEFEQWEDIPGLCGYQASDMGRIRSLTKTQIIKTRWGGEAERTIPGKVLNVFETKRGYVTFGTTGKTHSVHVCVAAAFLGEKPEGYEVDHINERRNDNRVSNLQYLTVAENRSKRTPKCGEASHFSKITNKERDDILALRGTATQAQVAKVYGLSRSRVGQIWN